MLIINCQKASTFVEMCKALNVAHLDKVDAQKNPLPRLGYHGVVGQGVLFIVSREVSRFEEGIFFWSDDIGYSRGG